MIHVRKLNDKKNQLKLSIHNQLCQYKMKSGTNRERQAVPIEMAILHEWEGRDDMVISQMKAIFNFTVK